MIGTPADRPKKKERAMSVRPEKGKKKMMMLPLRTIRRCTTCALMLLLLTLLLVFGAIIQAFEASEEISDNQAFRDFLATLEGALDDEQLDQIAEFAGRDRVEGFQGFSEFDAGVDDWVGSGARPFFGAVSYAFDLASTIGYGDTAAKTVGGRIFSILAIITLFPLVVVTYTRLADEILRTVGNKMISSSKRYKAVIKRYDQENLSLLNKRELYLIFTDLGLEVNADDTGIILEQFDISKDGRLDEAEFRKMCLDLKLRIGLLARSTLQLELSVLAFVVYVVFYSVITFVLIEEFDLFESFYFVFITVSTVGLGDLVVGQEFKPLFAVLSFIGIAFTALLFRALIGLLYERTNLHNRYFHRALEPVFDKHRKKVKSFKLVDAEKEGGELAVEPEAIAETEKADEKTDDI